MTVRTLDTHGGNRVLVSIHDDNGACVWRRSYPLARGDETSSRHIATRQATEMAQALLDIERQDDPR